MPTPLMKSFAKQAHKKSKTVEKLWKKSEKLVKKKYEIDEESDRFYPLVVGVLKHVLGLSKEEVNEDEAVDTSTPGETTTTNMGDYVYPTPIGIVSRFKFPKSKDVLKTNKSKKFTGAQYSVYVKKIVDAINENDMDCDELISSTLEHYCSNLTDPDEIVDYTIEAIGKYYGIVPSLFDELK